ncbi:MAG: hypothetical protein FWE61_04745 [Micrococcales bacterium]|nr:hypothetical protein [Micrococcales bacterium]
MSRLRRARVVVVRRALALAAVVVLVGCATSADQSDSISSRLDAYWDTITQKASVDLQEAIATCMKEHGFDYTPVVDTQTPDRRSPDDDPVAYAETNGYGIGTAAMHRQAATDDPNGAYYENLSDSEQRAYNNALYGEGSVDADALEDGDFSELRQGGCYDLAYDQVYGPLKLDEPSVLDQYYPYVLEQTSSHSRVRAALTQWVSCMDAKGYAFSDPDEALQGFLDRYQALASRGAFDDDDRPTNAFAALRAEEIATATADAQCKVQVGLDKAWQDAWRDAEAEFYDSHKDAVDAWFAQQEQSG